ncbi:MAG: hypothetical protein WA154_12910 [Moraxellaceae bacterium]
MDQAKDALKAFTANPVGQTTEAMKGVNASIIRAPGQLAGGMVDASADIGIFIGDSIEAGMVRAGVPKAQAEKTFSGKRAYGASLADTLSMRKTLGTYGNDAVNQFSTEAIASVIPMARATGVASRLATAAVGGAAGVNADSGQERLRNAALGAAGEGAGELVIRGAAAGYRALRRTTKATGTPGEAAQGALDRSFAAKRTEEARRVQAEAALKGESPEPLPQEELPTGTRRVDAGAAEGAPPTNPILEDANHALEVSGAAERLTPETLEHAPDGRIKVAPETKAAADEAGFGTAFANREDDFADAVIFKEEAEDGSSRVVGSMSREDLTEFKAEVESIGLAPDTINMGAGSQNGQWKMTHLGTPYDAAAVLRGVVDTLGPSPAGVTDETLMSSAKALADQIGGTTDEALAFAQSLASEQGGAHVAIKAVQTMWARYGKQVDDYLGIDLAAATDDEVTSIAQAIHDLQMFSIAMEEVKSGAGRNLRTLSLPDADTYLANLKRGLKDPESVVPVSPGDTPPLPRSREEVKQWMDMWDALSGDPAGRAALLKGLRTYPSGSLYLRTSLANLFTGLILSGPKTILLNVVGPSVVGGLRTLERSAGGMVGAINPLLSSADRAANFAAAQQAPLTYLQSMGDIADAFKYAAQTWKQSESVLGGPGPLDDISMHVPQPLIEAAKADGRTPIPYHLGNLLNVLPRAVWRAHGTVNELALSVAYKGEVRAQALLEATQQGLKGTDAWDLVRQRLAESIDEYDGRATDIGALDSANRTTMVRAPDPEMQPGVASFERTVTNWRKAVPELRFLLPIFQVPANGIGETIRRLPGVGLLLRETRQELGGTFGAYRQAEAHGRVLLGAGFLASASMMARNGQMTGAGPQDPKDRALWLATHQPYSIRVGDQWVAYDKMDPIGPLFAIAAGYFDDSVHRDMDQDTTLAAVGALAQYFKDKAAVQGIADVLNFGGDPRDQASILRRVGSIGRGFVPAFLGPVRVALDGEMRVKRNTWDYIKDAIPGYSATLDPVRNLLGEGVHKPQESIAENLLPVTLSSVSNYQVDPVLDEMRRLYEATGYTPGVKSPSLPGGKMDMRDVKLEDKHSLYDALMRQRRDITLDGLTLRETLQALHDSQEYADAVDGDASNLETDDGRENRGKLNQQVFQAFDKAALQRVAQESATAARYIAVAKAKGTNDAFLRAHSTEDLVKNPELLKALGINITDYEQEVTGQ